VILLMTRVDVLVSKNLVEREESLERSGCEKLWDGSMILGDKGELGTRVMLLIGLFIIIFSHYRL